MQWMPGIQVFQDTVSLAIPPDPALFGATFYLQWFLYWAQLRNPPVFGYEASEVGAATVGT